MPHVDDRQEFEAALRQQPADEDVPALSRGVEPVIHQSAINRSCEQREVTMSDKLSERVRAFLDARFPGSSIDDGYYFVRIVAPIEVQIRDEDRQRVAERVCAGRCWIISVGVDPRLHLKVLEGEQRTVTYNPDWNVERDLPQFLVEARTALIELDALLSEEQPSALVFIDPDHGIVFNAGLRRVYATSDADVQRIVSDEANT